MPAQADHLSPRRLSQYLAEDPPWTLGDRLKIFRLLVVQVQSLHSRGRIHRAIVSEAVVVDEQLRPQLDPPTPLRSFGRDDIDPLACPPELVGAADLKLPDDVQAARQVLSDQGFPLDPRRIDLYQLGALLCQLLTGRTLLAYLYDPIAKGSIPVAVRPLVDRLMGEGDAPPLSSCEELLALLDKTLAVHEQDGSETPARGSQLTMDPDTAIGVSTADLPPAEPSLPFARLGQFRILRRIGRGGMGDVYQALDEGLDRIVAIKVLPAELARDAEFVRRFRAEATAAAQLSHPNIVPVYCIREEAGHHFFAMQFVDGESLAARISRPNPMTLAEVLAVLRQCLAALRAAHRRGLVHRDIKPGNVLLDRRTGLAMLVDFGLVRALQSQTRMTATGVIMGTVDYIAPEQARGEPVDGRADLYSLGVVAYEMLASRLPFTADTPALIIAQHAYGKPQPLWRAAPDVPRALADIVDRMLAPRPEDRYQSAEEAMAEIEAFAWGGAVRAASAIMSRSIIARPPDFEAPLEMPDTQRWLKPTWWQAVRGWAMNLFRAHAPRFVQELQTTEQQVHGAVAEYQRRYDQLAGLVREAEDIASDLAARKQSYLEAARRAGQRQAAATTPEAVLAARQESDYCRQAAAEIERKEQDFQEDLADLRVREANVHAKLLELVNQRDLLEARYHAAQLRMGRRPPSRRRISPVVLAGTPLILLGILALYWIHRRMPETPPAPAASAIVPVAPQLPPQPTAPESKKTATFSALHGRKKDMPPCVLAFDQGRAVEFPMIGIEPDWLSKPFTAEILAKFDVNPERPFRIMGTLDRERPNLRSPGWALYLYPAATARDWEETAVADQIPIESPEHSVWSVETRRLTKGGDLRKAHRLVFEYAAAGEKLRRVVGPMFEPPDLWWQIEVSHRAPDHRIMIVLAKVPYLQHACQDMLSSRSPPRFSVGANRSADADFRGQIAGFQLYQADYAGRGGASSSLRIALDFAKPRPSRAIDLSGWGNHARLPSEMNWHRLADGPSPSYSSRLFPAAGKALVAGIGRSQGLELLDTQGLVGLTTSFTAEMWVRETYPGRNKVLLGDAVQDYGSGADGQRVGWSLMLERRLGGACRFVLEYPADSPSPGRLVSAEFPGTGGWHHVAVCNTPAECQIYLDGRPTLASQDGRSDALRKTWVPSPANLVLGERGSGAGHAYAMVRGFHLSARRLYQGAFDPPAVLKQDQDTLVLLDFSQRTGQFLRELSNNRREGFLARSALEEVDKDW